MPTVERKGVKGVYVELPPELLEQVRALAEGNGRAFRDEVEHALRRHLAAPPTVRVIVEAPPLASAQIERQDPAGSAEGTAPVKRPRGRPKGSGRKQPAQD